MPEAKETADPAVETAEAQPPASLPVAKTAPASAGPWDKVRRLALRQLDRFVLLEPKVLAGNNPDAIHDIRVASRRLQQVLDLLYPPPRSGEIRRLRRKIRRCRRALGEVRNCDVLLAYVGRLLARKRAPQRETWPAVHRYLLERRAQSFEKAIRKISKINLAIFYIHLKAWLSSNGMATPGSDHHAPAVPKKRPAEEFHERVAQDLGKYWQAFETQLAQSHRDSRPSAIHAVRIASKRLRYLTEVIQAFDVRGSREAIGWLRSVQQRLGDWNDLEVLERLMIEMIARPEFLRDQLELAMGVEKLILRTRVVKKRFAEKYFEMTRDAREFEWLKAWVSYLLASPPAALTKG
jgi:CHAD domain-containing protein